MDIIKSGGYKISALDVERHLLEHENILEVVVLGLPDVTWGQMVAAVIVTKDGNNIITESLKLWAKNQMAPYMVPKIVKCVKTIPRNNLGKVNKRQLQKEMFSEY